MKFLLSQNFLLMIQQLQLQKSFVVYLPMLPYLTYRFPSPRILTKTFILLPISIVFRTERLKKQSY